jgi:hypothetical protein
MLISLSRLQLRKQKRLIYTVYYYAALALESPSHDFEKENAVVYIILEYCIYKWMDTNELQITPKVRSKLRPVDPA